MPRDYWTCQVCKANLDHDEPCDCERGLTVIYEEVEREVPDILKSTDRGEALAYSY